MVLYENAIIGGKSESMMVNIVIALGLSIVLILMGIIIENSKKIV
jgi:hypothetical protein